MLELIPTIATSFATAMLSNTISNAQGPAQALDDLMVLSGFEKLHLYAEKKRAETEINIQSYKESIAQELIQIPEENIQEPQMSIVGPALEASKYYIEEKEIREMFAKIVAGSMDNRFSSNIHHSFVEVIKQLNKNDALFLKEFKSNFSIPSLKLYFSNTKEINRNLEERKLITNKLELPDIEKFSSLSHTELFYCSNEFKDFKKNSFIISNLIRLGIVIKTDSSYINTKRYDYQIQEFEKIKLSEVTQEEIIQLNNERKDIYTLERSTQLIELTPFGISFCNICVN